MKGFHLRTNFEKSRNYSYDGAHKFLPTLTIDALCHHDEDYTTKPMQHFVGSSIAGGMLLSLHYVSKGKTIPPLSTVIKAPPQ
jgi:hypothetical protein